VQVPGGAGKALLMSGSKGYSRFEWSLVKRFNLSSKK